MAGLAGRPCAVVALLTVCLGAPAPGAAIAGVVKGGVTFHGHALGSDAPAVDAVVVLHGPKAPAAARATIDQRQHRFIPRVLAVTVGTTVEFPNHDDVLHNVYSHSPAQRFDLGLYPPGETRSAVMEKPGVVEIECSAHADMKAYVIVSDSPYHAAVSAQGAYRIDDVPPGTYEIELWHPDFEPVKRPLEVPAGAPVLNMDLDLRTRRSAP